MQADNAIVATDLVPGSPADTTELIGEQLHSVSQKSLKICLLGYRSQPYGGGQGVYLRYLSKALVEAGHTVDRDAQRAESQTATV